MTAIEISYNGEWLGFPLHLWEGEEPERRVIDIQDTTTAKIGWRPWERGKP